LPTPTSDHDERSEDAGTRPGCYRLHFCTSCAAATAAAGDSVRRRLEVGGFVSTDTDRYRFGGSKIDVDGSQREIKSWSR
jgi:hypothetical protein